MIDAVLYEIGNLKWTFVIDFVIAVLLCAILLIITTKFNWNKRTVRFFGILYNLNYKQAISFGLIVSRICFVITNSISLESIGWGHLTVLFLYSVGMLILNGNFVIFINEIVSFTIIFFLQYIEMSLYGFYLRVDSHIVVLLMVILIGIFSVLYSIQQSLNSYESIISKNLEPRNRKRRRTIVND